MIRPRLLDLFCGAGGCSVGYHRAGFEVLGVDHAAQPRYPFEFVKADALMFLRCLLERCPEDNGGASIEDFAAIHASPPCQKFSALNRAVQAEHGDLVGRTRQLLETTGRPWVIENVEGAPLARGSMVLCGTMFGLRVRRHRVFETAPALAVLLPGCQCRNGVIRGRLIGHRVGGKVAPGRTKPPPATESDRREAIGVPWMTTMEARQAIPPAYTEWVGRQLLRAIAEPGESVLKKEACVT